MSRQPREERASPPAWIEPRLCNLVTKAPTSDSWVHEIKFDGSSHCSATLSSSDCARTSRHAKFGGRR